MDSPLEFPVPDGSIEKDVIIYGADMTWSAHIDNKVRDILILDEKPTQGLDDTAITGEAQHPINFTQSGESLFALSQNLY